MVEGARDRQCRPTAPGASSTHPLPPGPYGQVRGVWMHMSSERCYTRCCIEGTILLQHWGAGAPAASGPDMTKRAGVTDEFGQ